MAKTQMIVYREDVIDKNLEDVQDFLMSEVYENFGLNICDSCGIVIESEELYWVEHDERIKDELGKKLMLENIIAICPTCLREEEKLCQE